VIDHFGEQLTAAGYAYYGSEPLYSGLSGTVMHADIFIGLVYYQRLRHMVSDKSQVCVPALLHPCTVSAVDPSVSYACTVLLCTSFLCNLRYLLEWFA
jgi:RNA polymerase Rpb2, domain 6